MTGTLRAALRRRLLPGSTGTLRCSRGVERSRYLRLEDWSRYGPATYLRGGFFAFLGFFEAQSGTSGIYQPISDQDCPTPWAATRSRNFRTACLASVGLISSSWATSWVNAAHSWSVWGGFLAAV